MTTTSPAESATAATMTTMTASVQRGAPRPGFWRRLGYELSGLPMAVASFSFILAATIAGIVLTWTVVGLPVLAYALLLAGGFAAIERRRLGWLEGAQPPVYYRSADDGGFLRRSWTIIKDPQRWRDLVHALVIFPIRIFSFVLSVVFPVAGAGGTLYILWEWSVPRGRRDQTLAELIGLGSSRSADVALTTGIGLVLLVASPFVIRGLATMDAGLARALLSDENAGLRARVDRLAATRAAAVDAEARTLRKVERDIHDGPQQRLVRLTMDLQSAQRRLADDPAAAESLVSGALVHAQDALAELRAVSRGIAPPVLADRGLGAALAAAAARSPVPVTLDVRLEPGERLAPAVENALYYIVVESLTNVAKHADANQCTVTVERHRLNPAEPNADVVRAWVLDDGRGGAHIGKGHGIAGLVDRAAALDGRVTVESPAGGPTIVFAELPAGRPD
jgi:signal transduction histidine kinase